MFEFLVATGVRLGEANTLRWEWVHMKRRQLYLPDSKTDRKVVYLGDDALDVLHRAANENKKRSSIVFRSHTGKPIRNNIPHRWQAVRELAKLDGSDGKQPVRLHDLRHTYVSDAIMAGVPLDVAGGLVGHRSVKTTRRHAHLSNRVLAEAAAAIDKG